MMEIIKLNDVDFEYIGLAFFTDEQFKEMEIFFRKINQKLDKVVVQHSKSVYEVALAYRMEIYFVKVR